MDPLKRGIRLCLITLLLAAAAPSGADEPKTITHRVLGADYSTGRLAVVNTKGEIEWEVPNPYTVHDIQMLPNGNVLFQSTADTVVEMSPDKKVVWKYVAKPKSGYKGPVEVHACQRLDEGLTLVAESGNLRLVEVDRGGQIAHLSARLQYCESLEVGGSQYLWNTRNTRVSVTVECSGGVVWPARRVRVLPVRARSR